MIGFNDYQYTITQLFDLKTNCSKWQLICGMKNPSIVSRIQIKRNESEEFKVTPSVTCNDLVLTENGKNLSTKQEDLSRASFQILQIICLNRVVVQIIWYFWKKKVFGLAFKFYLKCHVNLSELTSILPEIIRKPFWWFQGK